MLRVGSESDWGDGLNRSERTFQNTTGNRDGLKDGLVDGLGPGTRGLVKCDAKKRQEMKMMNDAAPLRIGR